jgi:hypothetical protein
MGDLPEPEHVLENGEYSIHYEGKRVTGLFDTSDEAWAALNREHPQKRKYEF